MTTHGTLSWDEDCQPSDSSQVSRGSALSSLESNFSRHTLGGLLEQVYQQSRSTSLKDNDVRAHLPEATIQVSHYSVAGRTMRDSRLHQFHLNHPAAALSFYPCGRYLAITSALTVSIAQLACSKIVRVAAGPETLLHARSCVWVRDGMLAILWSGRQVALVMPSSGEVQQTFDLHSPLSTARAELTWQEDSRRLVLSADKHAEVIDLSGLKGRSWKFPTYCSEACSPNAAYLLSPASNGAAKLLDLKHPKVFVQRLLHPFDSVCWSPDAGKPCDIYINSSQYIFCKISVCLISLLQILSLSL